MLVSDNWGDMVEATGARRKQAGPSTYTLSGCLTSEYVPSSPTIGQNTTLHHRALMLSTNSMEAPSSVATRISIEAPAMAK